MCWCVAAAHQAVIHLLEVNCHGIGLHGGGARPWGPW